MSNTFLPQVLGFLRLINKRDAVCTFPNFYIDHTAKNRTKSLLRLTILKSGMSYCLTVVLYHNMTSKHIRNNLYKYLIFLQCV